MTSNQLKDGGGDIINISSVAGRTARSGNGVYAATKWGINGWSESLRQELLPDVRVTLVEPGVVATELPNHITHADTRQGVQQLYNKAEVSRAEVTRRRRHRPPGQHDQRAPRSVPPGNRSCSLMRSGTPEEVQQRRGEFVRRLFGLVVPGVDETAVQLAGHPRIPDRLGVAVDAEVIVC
jgi:NAD(P)-dependent dehydrogenase (short-subunit alcohol dehydrogenase family)